MVDSATKHNQESLTNRLPTREEINSAADATKAIAVAPELDGGLRISGKNDEPVKIAPAVGELIIELLGHVSNGNMVKLIPVGTMLTTQQTADMLNMSRPHLTKVIKEGQMTVEKGGKHRHVPLASLMKYRDQKALRQEQAMQDLARLGQDFDQE